MKQLLLFALLFPVSSYAQKGIENENGRKLYLGSNNRLFVPAEKAKPGSVLLGTDNGKVVKDTTTPGVFFMKPERIGKASIVMTQWYTKQVSRNDSVMYDVIEK